MSLRAAACVAWLACFGHAAGLRAQDDLWFRIDASSTSVACGEAFRLVVTVGAREGLTPEAVDPAALRPLRLREIESVSAERDGFVVRSTTYEARVAVAGSLVVEAPFARARAADGSTVVAFADDLELDVQEILPPDDAGGLELPEGPWRRPFSLRRAAPGIGFSLLMAISASWFVRRQIRAAALRRAAALQDPVRIARRELAELRARVDGADPHGFAAAIGAAIRTLLARGLGVPAARVLAREELVQLPAVQGHAWSQRFAAALADIDAVLFAASEIGPDRRRELCDVFEELVRAVEDRP